MKSDHKAASKLSSHRILSEHTRRVAMTHDLSLLDLVPDLLDLLLREMHLGRPDILLHILDLLRARDGYDVVSLRRQPRKRQLARRAALLICQCLEAVNQHQVLRKVLGAKAWHNTAEVVGRKVLSALDLTCQEPTA